MSLRRSSHRVCTAAFLLGALVVGCGPHDSELGAVAGQVNADSDATGGTVGASDPAVAGHDERAAGGTVNAPDPGAAGHDARAAGGTVNAPDQGAAGTDGVTAGEPCASVGEVRPDADGCGTCSCDAAGQWVCADHCVGTCTDDSGRTHQLGDTFLAADGCNMCVCSEGGEIGCDDSVCECIPGDSKPASDGCNSCACGDEGTWGCTQMDCSVACTPGFTRQDADGCCSCTEQGAWSCTQLEVPCAGCTYGNEFFGVGVSFPALDGCNVCSCDRNDTIDVTCTTEGCPAVLGKRYLIQVNRAIPMGEAADEVEPIPESSYEPVLDGPSYPVAFYTNGTKVQVSGNPEWGDTPWSGTLDETSANRRSYQIDQGLFAGGVLIIWLDEAGLQAELTLHGSGVPIIASERGLLVETESP